MSRRTLWTVTAAATVAGLWAVQAADVRPPAAPAAAVPGAPAAAVAAGTNGVSLVPAAPTFSSSMELPPIPPGTVDDVQSMGELTVITSDRLTYDGTKGYALFERNVVVSDPQMKMKTDKMTLFFEGSNQVKTIVAEGRVILSQADKMAWAGRATYDVPSGKVVLEDSPRVMRGRDMMLGDRITFWRDENRLECLPNARLIMYPDKNRKLNALPGGK